MSTGELSKEELLKILQCVREVEQSQPNRPIAVYVKVNYMTKDELTEVLGSIKPAMSQVYDAEGPQWAESRYQPV